jgi:predicted TIM-barrel fold metal-dependent hydrolase
MDIVECQLHLGPGGIDEKLAAMDALGIKAALIDEFWFDFHTPGRPGHPVPNTKLRRTSAPTAELASITHPDRFSYLVQVDRHDPELQATMRLIRDAPYARAIRTECFNAVEIAALAAGEFDELFTLASDYGLPAFLTIPGSAPLLRRYLDKFRDGKFIIDHCGMPFSAAMLKGLAAAGMANDDDVQVLKKTQRPTRAAEFEEVLRLGDCPNVALKWGHAPALFEVSGYPFLGLRPILRKALNAFGADRVMWTADIGANRTGESWAELLFWIMDNPDLSKEEREGVLGGAVRKWVNWKA